MSSVGKHFINAIEPLIAPYLSSHLCEENISLRVVIVKFKAYLASYSDSLRNVGNTISSSYLKAFSQLINMWSPSSFRFSANDGNVEFASIIYLNL